MTAMPVIHVVCPVCNSRLDLALPESFVLWGSIPITDVGCGVITLPGSVEAHMSQHREDGSLVAALLKHHEQQAEASRVTAERLREFTKEG